MTASGAPLQQPFPHTRPYPILRVSFHVPICVTEATSTRAECTTDTLKLKGDCRTGTFLRKCRMFDRFLVRIAIPGFFVITSFAAQAQTLPKFEIHETGYGLTSNSNGEYSAIVVDRKNNLLRTCSVSVRLDENVPTAISAGCGSVKPSDLPSLAHSRVAEKSIRYPGREEKIANLQPSYLWVIEQTTGAVSLCLLGLHSSQCIPVPTRSSE
jgi:hypothetical protein